MFCLLTAGKRHPVAGKACKATLLGRVVSENSVSLVVIAAVLLNKLKDSERHAETLSAAGTGDDLWHEHCNHPRHEGLSKAPSRSTGTFKENENDQRAQQEQRFHIG